MNANNENSLQEWSAVPVRASFEAIRKCLTPETVQTGVLCFFALCMWCVSNGRSVDFRLGPMAMKIS